MNEIGRCELGEQDIHPQGESGREPKRKQENPGQTEHLEQDSDDDLLHGLMRHPRGGRSALVGTSFLLFILIA